MQGKKRKQGTEVLALMAECDFKMAEYQHHIDTYNHAIQECVNREIKPLQDGIRQQRQAMEPWARIKAGIANPDSMVKYFPHMSRNEFLSWAERKLKE